MKCVRAAVIGLTAGAAFALAVTSASARDPVSVNDGPSWTGFYVGAAAGYGIGSTFTPDPIDLSQRGAQGFLSVGYDIQASPGIVLGVLADYAFGDLKGKQGSVDFGLNNQWAIGARLGFLPTSSSLWFATVGYTHAVFELSDGPSNIEVALNGFFLGGGVEQALNRNLSLKLEYRFLNYEDFRLGPVPFHSDAHSVRLGVNWKFGR